MKQIAVIAVLTLVFFVEMRRQRDTLSERDKAYQEFLSKHIQALMKRPEIYGNPAETHTHFSLLLGCRLVHQHPAYMHDFAAMKEVRRHHHKTLKKYWPDAFRYNTYVFHRLTWHKDKEDIMNYFKDLLEYDERLRQTYA